MNVIDYVCILLFLLAVLIVGGAFVRKEKNTDAFLLGSGAMPWWATGISCVMSILSTISVVGVPGEAFNHGLRYYIIELFVPPVGLAFFSLFVRFYFAAKTFTPYSYLEKRFDLRIRGIISVAFFLMRLAYLSMVLYSCSVIFKGVAEWNIPLTILCIGAVAVAYCVMGGLKAVVWVNVLKFFVLSIGIIIIIAMCAREVDGGIAGILSYSFKHGRGFNLSSKESDFFSLSPYIRITFWLLLFRITSDYMFLTSADQITVQQLLSTNSHRQARNSFLMSMAVLIPVVTILWLLGLCIFAYFGQHPPAEGKLAGDMALFKFIKHKLPTPLPGLIIATLLATAISTSGSALTALSTVATKDFYLRFFKPDASEKKQVIISRIFIFLIGIIAAGLAVTIYATAGSLGETIFEAQSMWMAMGWALIAPTFFIGVIFPRCNARHALAAIIAGAAATFCTIGWYIVSKRSGHPISFLFIPAPGLFTVISVGLLSQIFAKSQTANKTDNLTIWTLNRKQNIPAQ